MTPSSAFNITISCEYTVRLLVILPARRNPAIVWKNRNTFPWLLLHTLKCCLSSTLAVHGVVCTLLPKYQGNKLISVRDIFQHFGQLFFKIISILNGFKLHQKWRFLAKFENNRKNCLLSSLFSELNSAFNYATLVQIKLFPILHENTDFWKNSKIKTFFLFSLVSSKTINAT